MWWKHRYFKYISAIILFLVAIFFLRELNIFAPFMTIFTTLFYPILIAGFLFYIIRPVTNFLAKPAFMPYPVAILLTFAGIAGLVFLGFRFLASKIQQQITSISNLPEQLKEMANQAKNQMEKKDMGMISSGSWTNQITQYFGDLTQRIGEHFMQVFSTIVGAATVLVIVPFVLFFLLKDGHKLIPFLTRKFKGKKEKEAQSLLQEMDQTVSAYIIGQVTVAFVDGVLMFIGYLIIGLDYALILAIFVAVTAVVPFFGPIIGAIPAIVVALMQDPIMAIYVLIILIVVQQLEGNLLAPVIFSNRLNIHPLTIILLLVVAAPLYGFIGMVIAIPVYSVGKLLVKRGYDYFQMYKHST